VRRTKGKNRYKYEKKKLGKILFSPQSAEKNLRHTQTLPAATITHHNDAQTSGIKFSFGA